MSRDSRPGYTEEVIAFIDAAERNLTVWEGGVPRGYADFCGRHCNGTEIIRIFHRLHNRPDFRSSPNFRLQWPMLEFLQVCPPISLESSKRQAI